MSKSWSKSTRYLVLIMVIIGLIALVVAANDLIAPLAVSALLAYLLNPAVTFFNSRTKIRRQWAVLIVYLFSLLVIVAIATTTALIAPNQIGDMAIDLQVLVEEVIIQVETQLATTVTVLGIEIPLATLIESAPAISTELVRPDIVFEWLRTASTNLGWILVILVTTYYLLQDWPRLREWLIDLAPDDYKADARRIYLEIRSVWQRYLRGQLRLSLLIGLLTTLLLMAVGMPGAVAFGILAAIFDVILTIGPAFVMILAAAVAYVSGSSFLPLSPLWFMIVVLAIFGLIQSIENVWLRPRVMGQSLNMHPGVVFVAIIASLSLAGILAALIIVPVLGSTAVIARYIHAKIMDAPPWPEPDAPQEPLQPAHKRSNIPAPP